MKYDILNHNVPAMPSLGPGTECIKLLLSQVSKDMHQPLVPMIFPVLAAHVSGVEFKYPNNEWRELCGMMANLVGESGCNKGQLSLLVEAMMRSFREHDDKEMKKMVEAEKARSTRKTDNQLVKRQPEQAFWFPPADMTNAAFLTNAIACENLGNRTQYLNLPEIEMADCLCGNHKRVSLTLRNIYDRQRAGALRATVNGVSGNPLLRANFTISSTPYATRKFYRNDLYTGTFGRMIFSYKPREATRDGRIPRLGNFDDEFLSKLDVYLERLDQSKGRFIIKQLNRLIDKMANDMATMADLSDDDMLWDVAKRALNSAWKSGCVLWLLNNQNWTRSMSEMVEWLAYHDIWSKMQVFADLLAKGDTSLSEAKHRGPKNMLGDLPDTFTQAQLDAIRLDAGKSQEGTYDQLRKWVKRGLVTYDEVNGTYVKVKK